MKLFEALELVIMGVLLCVSISIPFLWLHYSKNYVNKILRISVFILLIPVFAYLFLKIYN